MHMVLCKVEDITAAANYAADIMFRVKETKGAPTQDLAGLQAEAWKEERRHGLDETQTPAFGDSHQCLKTCLDSESAALAMF